MSEIEYALGAHCGITFAGVKPASLFSLKKTELSSLEYYERVFSRKGFAFCPLKDNGDRILMYVYNEKQLKAVLFDSENKKFLNEKGYRYDSVDEAVDALKKRLNDRCFPHEIGVFLGYALEDVKGFISNPNEGVCMTGYWKVYANVEEKAKKFALFRRCSDNIIEKLMGGKPLTAIFRAV